MLTSQTGLTIATSIAHPTTAPPTYARAPVTTKITTKATLASSAISIEIENSGVQEGQLTISRVEYVIEQHPVPPLVLHLQFSRILLVGLISKWYILALQQLLFSQL